MKVKHLLLFLSVCLAFGGLGTVAVICGFIGFGLYSVVGKYAIYVALFLQLLNLLVNHCVTGSYRRAEYWHTPSLKMRRFSYVSLSLWALGTALLLASLVMILLGGSMTGVLNRSLCIIGCILSPCGWLGLLLASHRQRQAVEVLNPHTFPNDPPD